MRQKKTNPLEVMVMVRFTKAESEMLFALANAAGQSNAEFIREATRAAVRRNRSKLQMPQGG